MSSGAAGRVQRLGQGLRGVRGRLLATYMIAAVALAAAGVALFSFTLNRGLLANVDAALATRVDTIAADLGGPTSGENTDLRPSINPSRRQLADLQSVTAVYDPRGKLVDAQPTVLPASPLATGLTPGSSAIRSIRTTTFAGDAFRILSRPVVRRDGTWLVVVGQNLGVTNEASAKVRSTMLFAIPVLLILVGLGAWVLSGAALKPVDRMRADALELGEHNPAGRITEPKTRDSLNQLAKTFNALLDRLHNSLDRQRTLVADAGHELRTPLAVLQLELETAVRPTRSRDDLADSIDHARTEVVRLAALAEDLLLLAQADGGQPLIRRQLTDIAQLLDEVVASAVHRANGRPILLEVTRSPRMLADVDPVALRRIVDNLVNNALRFVSSDGAITVTAGELGAEPTAHGSASRIFVLRVCDTGPGFPPAFLPHAFDRFARADQGRTRSAATAGSGLGLAIVEALVKAHGGKATARNAADGGAVVEVQMPFEAESSQA